MARATISAGYPKALLAFAVAKGADRNALLARAHIAADDLAEQDNRIPLANYLALMEAAASLCNAPAIALQFGEAVRMQEISIVGLICEACETTREVGRQLNRYARLVIDQGGPADLMRGSMDQDGVWMEAAGETFDHPAMVEAELARLVVNARVMFAANADFQAMKFPLAVHFTHAEPAYRAEYERIFQAPVVFSSTRNALLIPPAFLALRQPPVNRYVFGVLSERAAILLADLESANSVRARVESLLLPILHTGDAGMEMVAGKLGLSRQTLFRKLKAEGTTFEKVLDELRHKMALGYLAGKKVSVNETAYLVGFSEPAAFSRAFKRWTGASPRASRGAAKSAPN